MVTTYTGICTLIHKNTHIILLYVYMSYYYSKGDYDGAIEQYILTIAKLEPSYVIRKVYHFI